jgi:3-oxoacyl-[acyl-carrier protein] reductase
MSMDLELEKAFDWAEVGAGLAESVTIVAGGARGTGRTAAYNLLGLGARVAIIDLHQDRVRETTEELQSFGDDRVVGLVADCTVANDIRRAVGEAANAFGSVNHLVYCAGAYRAQRPTLEVEPEEWDLIVDSNLKGAFLTYQAVIPHIVTAGGGSLVSISSLAGRTSSPFLGCHYSAAKAGILGLTRHIAKEFGPSNIRANSICPGGIIGARMNDLLTDLDRQDDLVQLARQTPLGRNGHELDVVGAILFLLSDLSRFVTGATIDVNGGILTV